MRLGGGGTTRVEGVSAGPAGLAGFGVSPSSLTITATSLERERVPSPRRQENPRKLRRGNGGGGGNGSRETPSRKPDEGPVGAAGGSPLSRSIPVMAGSRGPCR